MSTHFFKNALFFSFHSNVALMFVSCRWKGQIMKHLNISVSPSHFS